MSSSFKMNNFHRKLSIILAFLLLIGVTTIAYFPALSGGFIFDDFHSLKKLVVLRGEPNFQNIITYLGLSDTGPLKRPIPVLSFIWDASNWPADPKSFKVTNLVLHVLNGLLLFLLIFKICKLQPKDNKAALFIAFFATAFWLVHPFLLSTPMYVVRRMAMFPLTFMLMGFILYIRIRSNQQNHHNKSNLWLVLVVWSMTFLAMLSKENGVLFLAFIALFEVLIVQKYLGFQKLSGLVANFIYKIPMIVVGIMLLLVLPHFLERYDVREFTLLDRVLTELRVLATYLKHLVIPSYFTEGVFTDGFSFSRGLFEPISTLFSGILVLGLLVLAWFARNKYTWVSFAIFFFFVAHLIESTVIPLELYYEHRNYVASIFLFVPFAIFLSRISQKSLIYGMIPIAILVYLTFTTFLRANMWGDNLLLHEQTMEKFPNSKRAATLTADLYDRMGYQTNAFEILLRASDHHNDLDLKMNMLLIKCSNQSITDEDMSQLYLDFEQVPFTGFDLATYTALFKKLLDDECGLEQKKNYAFLLLQALEQNEFKDKEFAQASIKYYQAFYAVVEELDYDKAVTLFKQVYAINGSYDYLLSAIDELLEKEAYESALNVLNFTEANYQHDFKWKIDWNDLDEKLIEMRSIILTEMQKKL